jgi:hypothetical protein
MAITVHPASGAPHKTAVAFSRSGERPDPPAVGAASAAADFAQGVYAANLVTAAELTTVLGRPTGAPRPNGGNQLAPGNVMTSNGMATSTDGQRVVQWTVSRAPDPAAALVYFDLNASIAQPVANLGDRAETYMDHLEVLKGREVLDLEIVATSGQLAASAQKSMLIALANAMLPKMTGS